jgi:hypothetical protein
MQTTVQSLEELARQSRINYTTTANSPYFEYFKNMAGAEGGFQLLDFIIMELKSHITCQNSRSLIGGNFICQKKSFIRFVLKSECCNFNQ